MRGVGVIISQTLARLARGQLAPLPPPKIPPAPAKTKSESIKQFDKNARVFDVTVVSAVVSAEEVEGGSAMAMPSVVVAGVVLVGVVIVGVVAVVAAVAAGSDEEAGFEGASYDHTHGVIMRGRQQ